MPNIDSYISGLALATLRYSFLVAIIALTLWFGEPLLKGLTVYYFAATIFANTSLRKGENVFDKQIPLKSVYREVVDFRLKANADNYIQAGW